MKQPLRALTVSTRRLLLETARNLRQTDAWKPIKASLLKARAVKTLALCAATLVCSSAVADDYHLHTFKRQQLTDIYYSEGANFGDINGDGKPDVVHGPYWFEGPTFKKKHEIYPAKPQNRNRYANNFFSWVYDFNGDGTPDVFTVGFPGTPAYVYQNPGRKNLDRLWKKHQVFDWVSNESPRLTNIVGDDKPELVCTRDGKYGYATIDWKNPFKPWTFHAISKKVTATRFGHGLGIGDINGDKRLDLIAKNGWFEQPKSLASGGRKPAGNNPEADATGSPLWNFHPFEFTRAGGAEMFAYDVNGDGLNDVITSLQAHAFGLAWFEQVKKDGKISFKKHLIMGSKASENKYGVVFSELHSVNLVDMDGDGLKDIVTGKTYWSHHKQAPQWDAGAVVYWFKLVRKKSKVAFRSAKERASVRPTKKTSRPSSTAGNARAFAERKTTLVDWIPHKIDGKAGIGRQVTVGDINGDKLPDIVVGGMKGCHVLLHSKKKVSKAEYESHQPKPPRDLKSGLTPKEAAKHMTVPPGFRVQLAAGEPLVHQPIGFTIDHKGRLWVAEAYTYPVRAPQGKGKDKIVILEDTDGDGMLDKRKVFIEGLNLVSGIEVGFGGVYVGAAPYLMFIPDKNGDDIPDKPKASIRRKPADKSRASLRFPKDVPPGATVLLDGFGYQDTHETLNAFIWGPDGWLYGCHGVFTHSRVGKPGTPDAKRNPLNAGVWRYHPTKHKFEVFARGSSNPWGVDFNEHGQAFITACVIPHLYHVIQGARYQRQGGRHFNPHLYDDIKTIADHAHYVGNIRDHAWWGHEPQAPTPTLAAGGGHAHCGAMIYLGDNWPASYRNKIYMNNIHGNRVNCDVLVREGSGFVGRHGKDLLLANDKWFRGINLKYGPDGSVYLIDWYDKNACHRRNPDIWDRTNGRIYRVVYGNRKPVKVDLSKKSDAELLELQTHNNEWYVRMSRRLLQERTPRKAVRDDVVLARKLWVKIAKGKDAKQRLRALWAFHVIGAPYRDRVFPDILETEENENIRAWAIQLELEDRHADAKMLTLLEKLARTDKSPVVRLYLAAGCQRLSIKDRWPIVEALATHGEDAKDHNLPLMYWYAIEPCVTADAARALKLAEATKIPLLRRYIFRRAAADKNSLNTVVAQLVQPGVKPNRQEMILDELLAAFEGRVDIPMPKSWGVAYGPLALSQKESIRDKADQVAVILGDKRILPRMRKVLMDKQATLKKRQQALDILIKGRDDKAAPALQAVLSVPSLRGKAIRALAGIDDAKTPAAILAEYKNLKESEQADAIATLVSRPTYAKVLLTAIGEGKVPRTDLRAFHIRQLLAFKRGDLRKQIEKVWGKISESSADKKKLIASYKAKYTAAVLRRADRSNGRRLFKKTCANCHTLFGDGGKVGPDITGSNRGNIDYLLSNILDPSAVLGRDYRMTVIATKGGRLVQGLLKKETDSALTIRTVNDTVVVAKKEIDIRKLDNKSIMPERQLEQMKPNEVRDLIAYLQSPAQVPLRGPRSPIDPKTGKVPGALEGESMKIVGKTSGQTRNQNMAGFKADRWSGNDHLWWTGAKPGDKLSLEIPVKTAGKYTLQIALTKARDYGVVQLSLDGKKLGGPIDLYNARAVITTGVLEFTTGQLPAGKHRLTIAIVGANRRAVKAYMVGVDYVRLQLNDEK